MCGSALCKVGTGFAKAERAVDGKADVASVLVLLAIVFPPADRAKRKSASGLQGFVAAAWTAIANFVRVLHRA